MEFEQIGKRLEFLDEEQRKNKTAISDLAEQLTSLQTSLNALTKQTKALNKQIADIGPAAARLNQFDQMMAKQRTDLNKMIEDMDKRIQRREQEATKLRQTEIEGINKAISKITESTDMESVNKRFKERTMEDQRLNLALQDLKVEMENALGKVKEVVDSQKSVEENRRVDAKRINDIQGELSAIRKRADEAREKTVLHTDSIRNLENRINELMAGENDRKDKQAAFLEQQALAQVERDRAWKDWQQDYETFKKQAESMDSQVAALDETLRAAKRAQETYNELNQKLERRVSEVSEMQRLSEDRVRQEWVAFKADEQKRWTSHSLSQEETLRDLRKDMDKVQQNLTLLDDMSQTLQDQLHQTTDTTEQQLQELMNLAHEWLSSYERIMGHEKAKKASR